MRITRLLPGLLLVPILLGACDLLFSDEDAVWRQTRLYVPWTAMIDGRDLEGTVAEIAAAGSIDTPLEGRLRPGAKLPVVVFLHGCSGEMAGIPEKLVKRGFAVVAPWSFAREGRPESCGDVGPETLRWRLDEARWILRRLARQTWVDGHGIAVIGASEGGLAVAQFADAPDEADAFVILGWTCTDRRNTDFNGLRLPKGKPVMAVIGDQDPAAADARTGGNCGPALAGRAGSRSIVLRGLGHVVPPDGVFDEIATFIADARRK